MYGRTRFEREIADLDIERSYEQPSYERYSDARIDTIYITLTPDHIKKVDEAFERERKKIKYPSRPRFSFRLDFWIKVLAWNTMAAKKERSLRIQIIKKLLKKGEINEPAPPTEYNVNRPVDSLIVAITTDFQDQFNALSVFTQYMKTIPKEKVVIPQVSSFLDIVIQRMQNNLVDASTEILKKMVDSIPYVGKVSIDAFELYTKAKKEYVEQKATREAAIKKARDNKNAEDLAMFLDQESNRLTALRDNILTGINNTRNEYLDKFRGAKRHGNKKQVVEYEVMSAITQWDKAIRSNYLRDIKYYKSLFSAIWINNSSESNNPETGDIKIAFGLSYSSGQSIVSGISANVRAPFSTGIQKLLASNLSVNSAVKLEKLFSLPVRKTLTFFYPIHGRATGREGKVIAVPASKFVRLDELNMLREYKYDDKDLEKMFASIYDEETKTRLYKSGWLNAGKSTGEYVDPIVTLKKNVLEKSVYFVEE